MLIFAVDDERLALNEAQRAIAEAAPEAEIMTFLSALVAFRVRAQGYILKPLKAELVQEELQHLPVKQEKLTVRCFGCFEVFWRGEPLTCLALIFTPVIHFYQARRQFSPVSRSGKFLKNPLKSASGFAIK